MRLLLLLIACLPGLVTAAESRVATRLLAAPAADGDGYLLGLELRPERGWHTYWRNPGDAGLPPRLQWDLPPGAVIGPVRYPTPERHAEGELLTFGYSRPHILLSRLRLATPPSAIVPLKLEARWLVCRDICIPEQAKFSLTGEQLTDTNDQAPLASALAALPQPVSEISGRFEVTEENVRFAIALPGVDLAPLQRLHWFPGTPRMVAHAVEPRLYRRNQELIWAWDRHPDAPPPPDRSDGVLVADFGTGQRAWEVPLMAAGVDLSGSPWAPESAPLSARRNEFGSSLALLALAVILVLLGLVAMRWRRAW